MASILPEDVARLLQLFTMKQKQTERFFGSNRRAARCGLSYLDKPDENPSHALEVDSFVAIEHKNLSHPVR